MFFTSRPPLTTVGLSLFIRRPGPVGASGSANPCRRAENSQEFFPGPADCRPGPSFSPRTVRLRLYLATSLGRNNLPRRHVTAATFSLPNAAATLMVEAVTPHCRATSAGSRNTCIASFSFGCPLISTCRKCKIPSALRVVKVSYCKYGT